LFTLAQQFVELHLPKHAPQGGLRELRRRVQEIRDFDHRQFRIEHAKINHGVNLYGHVVACHHVLRRHFESIDAQRYTHDAVNGRKHQDQPRAFGVLQYTAQPEDNAALILRQYLDGRDQIQNDDQDDYQRWKIEHVQPRDRLGTGSTLKFKWST